jgi:NhaP-type Na+/H+ or K+/H+ antiporter
VFERRIRLETAPVIIFVGALVFLAHLFTGMFERTRIPDVLFLMLIGLVIGPLLKIVNPDDFGKVGPVFTTIALVVILFESGLELSLETLRRSLGGTVRITLLSFFIMFFLTTAAVFTLTGLPLAVSAFVGTVLAGPAPAVVIPLTRQLQLNKSVQTTLTLESALGEALCILIALAVMDFFQSSKPHLGEILGSFISSFLIAGIIGTLGGYLWSILLNKVRQLQNAIFTTPSFVFIIYGICEVLGFSGPVAVLLFGITIGNAGYFRIPWLVKKTKLAPLQHDVIEKMFFGEVVFLLKTFFFVYLGLSIQFSDVYSVLIALGLSSILLISRLLAVRVSMPKATTSLQDASIMSIMVPKGLATAVLASIPLQMGIIGGELIQNVVYSVVVFSTVLTAALIFFVDKPGLSQILGSFFPGFPKQIEHAPHQPVPAQNTPTPGLP